MENHIFFFFLLMSALVLSRLITSVPYIYIFSATFLEYVHCDSTCLLYNAFITMLPHSIVSKLNPRQKYLAAPVKPKIGSVCVRSNSE